MIRGNKTPSSPSRGMHMEYSPAKDSVRALSCSQFKTTLFKIQAWSTSKNYLDLRERYTTVKCYQGRSKKASDTAMVFRRGQTERRLEATGKTTWWRKGWWLPIWVSIQASLKLTRLGDSGWLAIRLLATKGSLLQTWWRDLAFWDKILLNTPETGNRTNSKVLECKSRRIVLVSVNGMRVSSLMGL